MNLYNSQLSMVQNKLHLYRWLSFTAATFSYNQISLVPLRNRDQPAGRSLFLYRRQPVMALSVRKSQPDVCIAIPRHCIRLARFIPHHKCFTLVRSTNGLYCTNIPILPFKLFETLLNRGQHILYNHFRFLLNKTIGQVMRMQWLMATRNYFPCSLKMMVLVLLVFPGLLLIHILLTVHAAYFFFPPLSMITAIRITAPFTTCCQNGDTFNNTRPLFSTPMITAPITVPPILPLPPDKEVPPITTAAIASKLITGTGIGLCRIKARGNHNTAYSSQSAGNAVYN